MNNNQTALQEWSPKILSVLRIVAGLLFVEHGSAKLLNFPVDQTLASVQLMSVHGVQALIELVGGGLLTVGLFSRPVAFILCADMAIVFFRINFPHGWSPLLNNGDLAVLFCFSFLYLWAAGPGSWSLDAMLQTRKRTGAVA